MQMRLQNLKEVKWLYVPPKGIIQVLYRTGTDPFLFAMRDFIGSSRISH